MDIREDEHIPDVVMEFWLSKHEDGDLAYEAAYGYPRIFAELFWDGERWEVSREDLAQCAGAAWWQWGDQCLDRSAWRELFDLAGYREDDDPADRPVEPLTLWRGATPEIRASWSWTGTRDLALLHASSYWVQSEVGLVWRAVVEPGRLLAKFKYEYVVDTDGLLVEPDGLWCRCPVSVDAFRGSDRDSRVALDIHELIDCPRL